MNARRTPGASAATLVNNDSLALRVMLVLAVVQGVFFLLPVAPADTRLVSIGLAIAVLLVSRPLKDRALPRQMACMVLSVAIVANLVVNLFVAAPNVPFRIFQLSIVLSYGALLLAGLTTAIAGLRFRHAFTAWGVLALMVVAMERIAGASDDVSTATGGVAWVGPVVNDSIVGTRFAPGATVRTLYPDNPRGYFDEPDVMQRRWSLFKFAGSDATVEFPAEKPGVLRVNIAEVPGRVNWHIWLGQSPLRIKLNARYEVRFRARADSARILVAGVGQAHDRYVTLGLYQAVRLDTAWQSFRLTFQATDSDRNARLFFDMGMHAPSVELSEISLRDLSSGELLETRAPKERSVTYELNSMGCRGREYTQQADSLRWRILAIGTGSTFGVGVHQRDTYAARLEALLNDPRRGAAAAPRFEVINCGLRDVTPALIPGVVNALAAHYAPDLVLLTVGPDDRSLGRGNDAAASPASSAARLVGLFHLGRLFQRRDKSESYAPDIASTVRMVGLAQASARSHGAKLALMVFQHRRGQYWTSLDSALAKAVPATVPTLNVGPALLPFGEPALVVHSRIDWHPNELAQRLAADALQKFLTERGLLGVVVGTDISARRDASSPRTP